MAEEAGSQLDSRRGQGEGLWWQPLGKEQHVSLLRTMELETLPRGTKPDTWTGVPLSPLPTLPSRMWWNQV